MGRPNVGSAMIVEHQLRQATPEDSARLRQLLRDGQYIHRHLDWRSPLEWLGQQPFWLLLGAERLEAALACPPDPPGVAWVRLFACSERERPSEAWHALFPRALENLGHTNVVAAIALRPWFATLLEHERFTLYQRVVTLWRDLNLPPGEPPTLLRAGGLIRPMHPDDLEAVEEVDTKAFEWLWRNSSGDIYRSWQQAAYASVAVIGDEIVGFQFSTLSPTNAHLARLAVHPSWQRRGIGQALLYDVMRYFCEHHISQLTVNTQQDNHASLALYRKAGFRLTGEDYLVYLYTH
ncbi:GNAT family N-acetyltransferase [uncultured Thermanaerothrix sp.]|uniref:GNAT family N-acetyltransferase n=1 Tax=uncultured Thermanaerothrix sp. TaxID=1195149 RepID=UPI002639046D|nr:GNAT family N-acetyltransferase [uncultured Thermanaerothrix sp.]